ncbi:hypothetical protein, partial [Enterococcus hirae]|uniref:hypothetical protein n=1 Tax=Enterococcus hirae TaxID=1354 RepID=UPI001962B780
IITVPYIRHNKNQHTLSIYGTKMHTFSFFLLITPQQKRKSPVKSLATIGGALHSLLGFLFAVSSMQEEIKDLCSISPLDNLHSLLH